jgi:hypothetical protein
LIFHWIWNDIRNRLRILIFTLFEIICKLLLQKLIKLKINVQEIFSLIRNIIFKSRSSVCFSNVVLLVLFKIKSNFRFILSLLFFYINQNGFFYLLLVFFVFYYYTWLLSFDTLVPELLRFFVVFVDFIFQNNSQSLVRWRFFLGAVVTALSSLTSGLLQLSQFIYINFPLQRSFSFSLQKISFLWNWTYLIFQITFLQIFIFPLAARPYQWIEHKVNLIRIIFRGCIN